MNISDLWTRATWTSIVLLAGLSAFASDGSYPDGLRPPLGDVLDAAGPTDLVPISVVLKDQVTVADLRRASAGRTGDDRRRAVLDRLKANARGTQGPIVRLLDAERAGGRAARLRPLWIGNVVGVDATPDLVRAIAARPEVAWVNHNPKVDVALLLPRSLDENTSSFESGTAAAVECGTDRMDAPRVWNELGITGNGAVIAVVDSGTCITHPDIANQVWVNPGEDLDGDGVVMDVDDENGVDDDGNGFVDDLIGWDFDTDDNDPDDTNSHGSHVAGTVAGDGTSGTQAGMAPDAALMIVRVGLQFSDEVSVWSGMQYAADNGADSITMSLGWPHNQNPDRATWRQNSENTIEAGTAMVIAAGNEGAGNEPDNIRTPGDVPRIISVAATDCSDNIASFSSRGPVSWQGVAPYDDHPYPPGLVKPDVAGPGVSTVSHNFCSGYSSKSGTSMATPHVAGAVALMIEANPGLLHDEIKQVLMDTSVDLGAPGKDNVYGQGRVDAFAAVDAVFGLSFLSATVVDSDPNHGNGDGSPDTGELVTIQVALESQFDDQVAADVHGFLTTTTPGVRLVHDYGTWPDIPPLGTGVTTAPHFSFRVDADCNVPIEFSLRLRYNDRESQARFSVLVGSPFGRQLIVDDFESDQGWVAGGTATAGLFVRDDPREVKDSSKNVVQPDDDATPDPGVHAWVTGNGPGPNGSDDVDGGTSTVTSPAFDATDFAALTLSYSRWYYAFPSTAPPSDYLRVQWSRDGTTWNTVEELNGGDPSWVARDVPLPASAFGPGLQIRFMADDDPVVSIDSVVELVIDEVSLAGERIECDPFTAPGLDPPNAVGDTLRVDLDGDHVRLDWGVPPIDGSHGPATLYRIHRSSSPALGFVEDGLSTEPWHLEPDEALDASPAFWVVEATNSGGSETPSP